VTTAAPPRPDVDEFEQRATDRPGNVCHLLSTAGALCANANGHSGLFVDGAIESGLDPAASPCSCARARCAGCAAEYTMRSAA
jgi:hypothetical protein